MPPPEAALFNIHGRPNLHVPPLNLNLTSGNASPRDKIHGGVGGGGGVIVGGLNTSSGLTAPNALVRERTGMHYEPNTLPRKQSSNPQQQLPLQFISSSLPQQITQKQNNLHVNKQKSPAGSSPVVQVWYTSPIFIYLILMDFQSSFHAILFLHFFFLFSFLEWNSIWI
jgi:hypothetical protein